MIGVAWTVFDTPIGRCGIAWSDRGVAAVQLPEATETVMRARLRRRYQQGAEAAAPPRIGAAIDGIVALLNGEGADLSEVTLDMEGVTDFDRRVYEVARTIPPGGTLTYGEIAERLGAPGTARAVGQALGRNPFPVIVPCHRVVAAGGKAGGFSAYGGHATKLRMLAIERRVTDGLPLFAAAQPSETARTPTSCDGSGV